MVLKWYFDGTLQLKDCNINEINSISFLKKDIKIENVHKDTI
jgi:hypothetical protein